MKKDNTDFQTSYKALRLQAEHHGLDVNDEKVNNFLIHLAEVDASNHAMLRKAQNMLHLV